MIYDSEVQEEFAKLRQQLTSAQAECERLRKVVEAADVMRTHWYLGTRCSDRHTAYDAARAELDAKKEGGEKC